MGRHNRRRLRPVVERVEARELLSLYTVLMMANQRSAQYPMALHQDLAGGSGGGLSAAGQGGHARGTTGFVPSKSSVAVPQNQGPQGTNLALAPTGTLTSHELKHEQFSAIFTGPYTIGAGRTDTEALHIYIRGAGRANTIRHGDIQLRIITPKDPATQIGAVMAIFDRNLNSNTVLGLDGTAPQVDASGRRVNVDRAGRPDHLAQLSIDVNESAGVYDEAFSQGTLDIRYFPNGKHTPGVISQGTAVVKIRAQIYAPNVDFILRNSDINP